MKNAKAVFLDRDGTLNAMVYDQTHGLMDSPRRPEQVQVLPGAAEFIRGVRDLGFRVVVVTNQPGLAKGTLTERELEAVNQALAGALAAAGADWDELRYCPHHPHGGPGGRREWIRDCDCRKPKPGLLRAAASAAGLDLAQCWMVGDGLNDVEAGQAAGCRTILVTRLKLEQIERFLEFPSGPPTAIARDLAAALEVLRGAAAG